MTFFPAHHSIILYMTCISIFLPSFYIHISFLVITTVLPSCLTFITLIEQPLYTIIYFADYRRILGLKTLSLTFSGNQ